MTNEVALSGEVVALFPVGSLQSGELRTFFQRPKKPFPIPRWTPKLGVCIHSHYKQDDNEEWNLITCSEPALTGEGVSNGFLCLTHQGDIYRKRETHKVDWDMVTIRDIIYTDQVAITHGKVTEVASCHGHKLKIWS